MRARARATGDRSRKGAEASLLRLHGREEELVDQRVSRLLALSPGDHAIFVRNFDEETIASLQEHSSREIPKPSQDAFVQAGVDVRQTALKAWVVAGRRI